MSGFLQETALLSDVDSWDPNADRLVLMDGGQEVASGAPREVLTEQLVARHYGADVRVIVDEEAGIAVVPLRPRVASEESVA